MNLRRSPNVFRYLALSGVLALSPTVRGQTPARTHYPPVVHLTAAQDHARMMRLLGIQRLRPGADPNNPNSPNAPNYDEAKARRFKKLPDPLVMDNGNPVRTHTQWWLERRPEIEQAFTEDVYGRIPDDVPAVHWRVVSQRREVRGGVAVVVKQLQGHVDNSAYPLLTVNIPVTLVIPANASAPVPVMIHFAFDPVLLQRFLAMAKKRGFKLPPPPKGPSWKQQLLNRGWGYASLIPTRVQDDNGAGLTQGIIGLTNHGQPRQPDQWGTLRAWAWAASRTLDYLQTDKAVNAHEVGIEGLSRFGKAALVTEAYDQRFAIGLIGSSGKGGAALYRRNFGERNGNLAGTGEYHWMAGNFMKYVGPLTANDLPVDSHELIAMCAPRPVFLSSGKPEVEGKWLDMTGEYEAGVAAGAVYRFLGKQGLSSAQIPPIGTALLRGDIGWREHHGGHTDIPNWPAFIQFAGKYFK